MGRSEPGLCGASHSLNSVNGERTTEHERTTGAANLPTIEHASFPRFPSVCVSTTTSVTSQSCQMNHTCCNVITHIKLIRKHVTQVCVCVGGVLDIRGGALLGAGGGARCTLVLRCLQEMFRCFVQGRRVQLSLMKSTTEFASGIL